MRITIIFTIIFHILSLNLIAKNKIIKIFYFERYPYYYTASTGEVRGIIIDITTKIFNHAKIKYKYVKLPVKRILYELKKPDVYACSPGWYYNEKRAKIYKYTYPIYESQPIVAVFNSKISIPEEVSLKYLLEKHYNLGVISGFSYGKIIDDFLKKYPKKYLYKLTGNPEQLLLLVAKNRVNYTLYSYEHVNNYLKVHPELKLKLVKINEIKKGIKRYIICSKDVEDKVIKKLNKSILELNLLK